MYITNLHKMLCKTSNEVMLGSTLNFLYSSLLLSVLLACKWALKLLHSLIPLQITFIRMASFSYSKRLAMTKNSDRRVCVSMSADRCLCVSIYPVTAWYVISSQVTLIISSGFYHSVVSNFHERFLNLCRDVLGVRAVTDHPPVVRVLYSFPADRAGLVVDIPLLDTGDAVGVSAGQDQVRPPLDTDTALLHWTSP